MAVVVGCSLAAMAALAALAAPAQAGPISGPCTGDTPCPTLYNWNQGCTVCISSPGENYIDPAGSLQAGQPVQEQLTGTTAAGQPAAGAIVFLSARLTGGGAAGLVGGTRLTSRPQAFTLDSAGVLTVTYQAATVLPAVGIDTLTAAGTATGSGSVTTSYNYDSPAFYVVSPVPLAPAGSLAAGQSATAQVNAFDAAGSPVAGALVSYSDNRRNPDGSPGCGTWTVRHPSGPPGPVVGSAGNPGYGFTDAAGQLGFTFTPSGSTGATSVLSVAGAVPRTAPVTTSYQC
jgi:hypothetical protein